MATHTVIEYDLEKLGVMDTNALILQQIARMDLDRPRREHDLDADTYRAKVVDAVDKYIVLLGELGVPKLTEALNKAKEDFQEEGQ